MNSGKAEDPAHQHREDQGEEGDGDEVFHDTSLLSFVIDLNGQLKKTISKQRANCCDPIFIKMLGSV